MRALLRFDGARKRHPGVERWLAAHRDPLGDLARTWFEALRQCGEDVVEVLHDGQPTACVDGAAFAYVDVFAVHLNVGFFQGAELPDPAGLLQGSGKYMRHVKIKPESRGHEDSLSALIRAAYADVKTRLERQ